MSDLAHDTPAGPVTCRGVTPELAGYFSVQAPAWPTTDDNNPIGEVTVRADTGGWRFISSNYQAPDFRFDDGLGAGNGLVGCLIHTFIAGSEDWIAFHAGAVETDGGLTVLAGDMMAGKSTLAAAMVAIGHRLWCDDRLPVCRGASGFEGMSLALRPKLRQPLPENAPDSFRAFAEERAGPAEGVMRYLLLKRGEAAGYDERLPVRRIVLLERADDAGAPAIGPISLGETVKRLTACTFAPHLGPVGLLERLRAIATASECILLRYDDSFKAASLAQEQWGLGR